MKEKISDILNTRFNRVTAIAACATLILSLGAVSAFAAGILPSEGFFVRNDNGNVNYSADGGATWTEGTPDNFHVEYGEDGSALSWVGDEEPNIDGAFMAKNENGTTYYSTDGGTVWSETAPSGYEQTVNPDGSISIKNEVGGNASNEASLVKNEDGVISYSTDDGATWTLGAPDNYHVEYGENGGSLSWVGDERPEPGDGAFTVKIENGTTYYSMDGGATWSETAPDGFEQTINADGSVSVKKN